MKNAKQIIASTADLLRIGYIVYTEQDDKIEALAITLSESDAIKLAKKEADWREGIKVYDTYGDEIIWTSEEG